MAFSSQEFKAFGRDVVLTTSNSRYPQSTGMAERAVQITKVCYAGHLLAGLICSSCFWTIGILQ